MSWYSSLLARDREELVNMRNFPCAKKSIAAKFWRRERLECQMVIRGPERRLRRREGVFDMPRLYSLVSMSKEGEQTG